MSPVIRLVKHDLRNITRDPMLFFYLLAPMLLIAALRFGVPYLSALLEQYLQMDLTVYYNVITSTALLLLTLTLGCMSGFIMLDERDENIIQYFAVTPLSISGYVQYRLALATVMSLIYSILLLSYVGLVSMPWDGYVLLLPMVALESPMIALCLVAFAANKVEGLALTKGISLIVVIPAVSHFIQSSWQMIAGISPTYWIHRTFIAGVAGDFRGIFLNAAIGYTLHLLLLGYLYRRFRFRTD